MNQTTYRRSVGLLSLLTVLLLVLAPAAYAFEGRTGEEVVIPTGEVIDDDLYVTANTFRLEGTVKGDLIALGTNVIINGTVEGDLLAAGQSISVNGRLMDDARLLGMVTTLGQAAAVGDDVAMVGLSLESQTESAVGGDLFFVGAQSILAGAIAGNARVSATALELRGQIGGDLEADVGGENEGLDVGGGFSPFSFIPNMPEIPSVSGGLTVAPNAVVGGDLRYSAPVEFSLPSGAVAGATRFTRQIPDIQEEVQPTPTEQALDSFLRYARTWVALFLVGLLMVWLVPMATQRVGELVGDRPLPSFGWGLVTVGAVIGAFLLGVIAMVLLAVILGALTLDNLVGTVIWVGLLTLFALVVAFGLAIAYASKITVCCEGGRLVLARLKPDWAEGRVLPLGVGLLIFVILTAIPLVGGLVNLVVVLLGLGGLWLLGREYLARPAGLAAAQAS